MECERKIYIHASECEIVHKKKTPPMFHAIWPIGINDTRFVWCAISHSL